MAAWLRVRDDLFAPRAIDMIHSHDAVDGHDYALVWTSNEGDIMWDVASRRIFEVQPLPIFVEDVERVGTDALIEVLIFKHSVVTAQSETGNTH